MKIFKEKVYPPHKLTDIAVVDGVRFNLGLLKSLTWLEHFKRVDNEDLLLCLLPPEPTKTRTVTPPSKLSKINEVFLYQD